MRPWPVRRAWLFGWALFTVMAAGCASNMMGSAPEAPDGMYDAGEPAGGDSDARQLAQESAGAGSSAPGSFAPADAAAEPPAALVSAATPFPPGAAPLGDPNRKIIKDAQLAIVVEHLELGVSRLNGVAAQAGGYVLETKTDLSQEYHRQADVKIAVPVDQFEATLERIRQAAKTVQSEQASGVDASQEYVDLQSEIANLEATAARIREFLNQADSVAEALEVNAKLTEIEGQIGQRKGRSNYIAQRAAYSTIAVHLEETPPDVTPTPTATPTPLPAWRPGTTVYEATTSLTALLRVLGNLAIWLVIVGLPVGLIAAAVWWVGRWVWGRLKVRK